MEEKDELISSSQHQPLATGWEPIHFQHQPEEAQAHPKEWQLIDNTADDDDDVDDFSVFPPSNHEGLHIQPQPQDDVVEQEDAPPQSQPSPPPPPSGVDDRIQFARDLVMNKLNSGFERILHFASSARSRYVTRGRANRSWFVFGSGVAVAVAVSLWYLRWQRWRRQSKEEKIDHLILLVRQQDQKISQLMDNISRLNEVVSSRRTISIFGGC